MLKNVVKRLIPKRFHALAAEMARLTWTTYRAPAISQANWDQQYADGFWNYLEQDNELPKYSLIAGYCTMHKPGGAILDVGCGTGVLYRRLASSGLAHYQGVDLSERAIEMAQKHASPNVRFAAGDAETYSPDRTFDVIVFNEILYYLQNPRETLLQYSRYLSPGGLIVISIYTAKANFHVWKLIEDFAPLHDAVSITNLRSNMNWIIKVYSPTVGKSDEKK